VTTGIHSGRWPVICSTTSRTRCVARLKNLPAEPLQWGGSRKTFLRRAIPTRRQGSGRKPSKQLEMARQMHTSEPDEVARNGALGKNTSARGISLCPFAFPAAWSTPPRFRQPSPNHLISLPDRRGILFWNFRDRSNPLLEAAFRGGGNRSFLLGGFVIGGRPMANDSQASTSFCRISIPA
jgi:hypothetical protein